MQTPYIRITIKYYFFISIGWPQQVKVPFPALVTMNSELHFVQIYRLPITFVMLLLPPPLILFQK